MLTRRLLLLGTLLGSAVLAGSAAEAAAPVPFDQAAFEAAQAAGRPILVHITAPWCPNCKAQKPNIAQIGANPKFKDMAIFSIDFDSQRAIVRAFDARSQSTLIAFKGKTEVGRSVGETQPEWIESFLEKVR